MVACVVLGVVPQLFPAGCLLATGDGGQKLPQEIVDYFGRRLLTEIAIIMVAAITPRIPIPSMISKGESNIITS